MRTSKDEYKTKEGKSVFISADEKPPIETTLYSGYDYQKQCWIFQGKKDTRTLQELREAVNQA